jgi:hypothetical protein
VTIQSLVRGLGQCGISAVLICLSACPNSNVAPATPVNFSLQIPDSGFGNSFATTLPSTSATPSSPQSYNVLPLISSAIIVRAYLTTPYPTGLAIAATDDTGQSVTIPLVPANSQGPSTGFFQVISVGATNPTQWYIVIRFPDSFKSSRMVTTAISDVSGQQTSAPFSFALVSMATTVNVKIVTANNDGMVQSNPPGINCPGACSFNFNGLTSVVLKQTVLHNQTEFTGWQGNCSGPSSTCTLQLNGTTVAATANFRIHSSTAFPPDLMMCPAAPVIPGKTWVEPPNCGTIPTGQGATLQCDAQGYFCCGASTTTQQDPTMRCHGQKLTLVTCMPDNTGNMGNNEALLPADKPLGCYVPDMFP